MEIIDLSKKILSSNRLKSGKKKTNQTNFPVLWKDEDM